MLNRIPLLVISEDVFSFIRISPAALFHLTFSQTLVLPHAHPVSIEIVDLSFYSIAIVCIHNAIPSAFTHVPTISPGFPLPLTFPARFCQGSRILLLLSGWFYFCYVYSSPFLLSARLPKKGMKPMKNVWKRWVDFNNSIISVNVGAKTSRTSD